jgi:hypothetical protein
MVETVIGLLIYILILALVFYLIVWVMGIIGVTLPPKGLQILMAIFALIVILMLYQALVGGGGIHLPRLGAG